MMLRILIKKKLTKPRINPIEEKKTRLYIFSLEKTAVVFIIILVYLITFVFIVFLYYYFISLD